MRGKARILGGPFRGCSRDEYYGKLAYTNLHGAVSFLAEALVVTGKVSLVVLVEL